MIRLRLAPLVLGLALLPSVPACGGQLKAHTQYAEGTDFSGYQTFRWITDDLVLIQSGTGHEGIRNVENEKLIRAAVERELQAKGLTKGEADADLVVAFTVGTKVRYKLEGGEGFGVVTSGPGEPVTRGTLTLYFFDPGSQEQVWEAWTSKDLDPKAGSPEAVVNAAVGVLMQQFPPS